jgi:beta-galactosidase/beta-glucuronidase
MGGNYVRLAHYPRDERMTRLADRMGGEAKYGLHGDSDARWTEDNQANIYRHQLLMLQGIGQGMATGEN